MREVAKTRKRFLSVMAEKIEIVTFRQLTQLFTGFCLPRHRRDRNQPTGSALLSRVRCPGWHEVKLPFALFLNTTRFQATTAYVHPIARHYHDRAGPKSFAEATSAPVYQTPLMITFLTSLLCECSGLSVPAGTFTDLCLRSCDSGRMKEHLTAYPFFPVTQSTSTP